MIIKTRLISGALLIALSVNTFAVSLPSSAPISVSQPQISTWQQGQTKPILQHGYTSYRRSEYRPRTRRSSKTKMLLRIAAPAALGAGIGALAGGKKGAGIGALLGGGGGAAYHLYKTRRR